MQKILIIGKFNSYIKELRDELSKTYEIVFCVDNAGLFEEFMKIHKPDVVLVYLSGISDEVKGIINVIYNGFPDVVKVCLGYMTELESCIAPEQSSYFKTIARPVENSVVMLKIKKLLEKNFSDKETDKPARIMLVDDDPMQLRIISRLIEGNYSVICAASGTQALEMLEENEPDLIFLDYEMPQMNGKETFQKIRENERFKKLPVAFLTGISDREHIMGVIELNPIGYVLKPATKDNIMNIINKVFNK